MPPTFRKGNMWSAFDSADLFCITTNNTLTKDGALVMGAGIAKQAAQRFPDLPLQAGRVAMLRSRSGRYGLQLPDKFGKLALFQSKYHWRDPSDLALIRYSAGMLTTWCQIWAFQHRGTPPRVHLNFPGIGLGGLKREDVLPILDTLPSCVTVWEAR